METETLVIEISGLKPRHAKAIHALLCAWGHLCDVGSSRWTHFFVDGDGDFHPEVKINGEPPQPHRGGKWNPGGGFELDPDWITTDDD